MKFIRLCAAFSLFVFCSCTSVKSIQKNTDDGDLDRYSKEIVSAIKGMTVREKIGQMFCVVPENFDFNLSQKQIDMDTVSSSCMVSAEMKKNLKQYPVGGIIYFRKNLESPEQIKKMMNDFDSVSKVPLIHSTDEEGGRVARVARVEKFETKKLVLPLK
ncbi:MAG: glycoside hydrolase family 3 N-terminal domain-containing protein [Treponema sp.]|nr:glycoside hydrolase family 3 N-terminal domain-containing protein [Treponema sp.]